VPARYQSARVLDIRCIATSCVPPCFSVRSKQGSKSRSSVRGLTAWPRLSSRRRGDDGQTDGSESLCSLPLDGYQALSHPCTFRSAFLDRVTRVIKIFRCVDSIKVTLRGWRTKQNPRPRLTQPNKLSHKERSRKDFLEDGWQVTPTNSFSVFERLCEWAIFDSKFISWYLWWNFYHRVLS